MFKSGRWRSEKNKIKIVFKLQFHATLVNSFFFPEHKLSAKVNFEKVKNSESDNLIWPEWTVKFSFLFFFVEFRSLIVCCQVSELKGEGLTISLVPGDVGSLRCTRRWSLFRMWRHAKLIKESIILFFQPRLGVTTLLYIFHLSLCVLSFYFVVVARDLLSLVWWERLPKVRFSKMLTLIKNSINV